MKKEGHFVLKYDDEESFNYGISFIGTERFCSLQKNKIVCY